MNRREMLKEATVAIVASQLPAFAVPEGGRNSSALDPLPDYLGEYQPPKGAANDPGRAQTLTFDIVEWRVGPKRRKVTNAVIGELVVKRLPQSGKVVYQTERRIRKVETVGGEYVCDAAGHLRKWDLTQVLHRAGNPRRVELLTTRQTGRADADGYELVRDGGSRRQALGVPLTFQGAMIDALASADFAGRPEFAEVAGVSGVRPNQSLRLQGEQQVAGEAMRVFLQTGTGTLPTHWVVDGAGRPLFITTFLLSLALVRID